MPKFFKAVIFLITLPLLLYPQSQDIKFAHISMEHGLSYEKEMNNSKLFSPLTGAFFKV
jgi:hypothetical protein